MIHGWTSMGYEKLEKSKKELYRLWTHPDYPNVIVCIHAEHGARTIPTLHAMTSKENDE